MNDRLKWLASVCFALALLISLLDVLFPGSKAVICAPFGQAGEHSIQNK
jgi:hypothetical protein